MPEMSTSSKGYLAGAIIALVIGLILLIVGVLMQTEVIKGTDSYPVDSSSGWLYLMDAIGVILIIVAIWMFSRMGVLKNIM